MKICLKNRWVPVAFLILTGIYFWPVLFGGEVLLVRDAHTFFHGMKYFYRESILNGEFPFWCPYTQCGTPVLANLQFAFLNPLSVVFIIFPADYAIGAYAALHMWMFACFIYLLARECRLEAGPSWIAGCGAFLASMPLQAAECPEHMAGFTWMPLVIYFFLGLLRTGGWGKSLGLAIAGAMLVYSGSPYPLLMILVSLIAVGLPYVIVNRPSLKRCILPAVACALLAFCLAAPQLLPTVELSKELPKEILLQQGRDRDVYSLLPVDWMTMLFPYLYGFPRPTMSIYLGIVTPLLLVVGILAFVFGRNVMAANDERSCPVSSSAPKYAPSMITLLALGVIMACGSYLHVDRVIELFPLLIRCYSYPCQYSYMGILAAAILGGISLQYMIRRRDDRRFRKIMMCGAGFVGIAGMITFLLSPLVVDWITTMRHSPRMTGGLMSASGAPETFSAIKGVRLFSLFWTCGAIILMALFYKRIRIFWVLAAFTLLILADKAFYMADLRLFSKENAYVMESNTIKALKSLGADKELVRVHANNNMLGYTHITTGSTDINDFLLVRDWLPEQIGIPYHFYMTYGGGALRLPEFEYILKPLMDRLAPWQNDRLRGLWNVKYILEFSTIDGRLSYKLRENKQFMPRAWLSAGAWPVRSWDECLNIVLNPNFNPRGTTLLFADKNEIAEELFGIVGNNMDVASISYTSNTVTISASADKKSILFLSDAYYKGWRAYIDGKETKIYKANLAGKAVVFPAGLHTVKFVYSPGSFWLGVKLFFVGIGGIVAVALALRYLKGKNEIRIDEVAE